tara:strand:+ start:1546 stop:8064 length:6519 start_codon:yes stop_codon:yes gene_type:complete
MGLIKFHGRALRLNGFTDGLVVPTGKYRESGIDLREAAFAATVKMTKSHATKIGRKHIENKSNPLNALRGAFTIDAYIIPDYGGVIVEKEGSFRLKYGEPFGNGKLVFEVHTNDRGYVAGTSYDIPVKIESNSGLYSSSSNAHRPQDFTVGEQGLVLITAQYTQKELRCFINGDLVCEANLAGEGGFLADSSSDIFIGGKGGEFRGLIESVRITNGVENPVLQPLISTKNTFGLWDFNDEYEVPEVYFFDDRGGSSGSQSLDSADRQGTPLQGRDGAGNHDGLLDIPMVAIGYNFASGSFKVRDYPANPGSVTDSYSALEKLAALTQGIELEEVRNQTWYSSTLDLTADAYLTGVNATVLNAVINHSGTSPVTGIITPPDTEKVRFDNNSVVSASTTSTLNPSVNQIERVRITGLDFANGEIDYTSIHLANDTSTADNLPVTQGRLFTHTDNTPVWFTIGKADLLIDGGTNTIAGSAVRTRNKDTFTLALFTQGQRFSDSSGYKNDAYFFSTQSRSTTSTDANTLYDSSATYAGMGAVTAYTLYEGDFFLKMMPIPDSQRVKQTIQGIANTFYYEADDMNIQSLVSENEKVRVTEPAYHGEITKIINKTLSVGAAESGGSNVFNRIVVEHGVGHYESGNSYNVFASTRDEIVAIAVSDPKPFMLKGLDAEHTAEFSGGVPTNDNYIRHLTPEDKPRIATIDSPQLLIDNGGPKKVLVYYDAIDLTGEVIAGTSLANGDVSGASGTRFRKDHATGNAAYLVVRKTLPAGSALFGSRTLSDWLRRPYAGNQTDTSAIALTINAPGGLVALPTKSFNDKPASHTLRSNPTGDITPSPFINIENTVYSVGTGIGGYGRPRAIPSTNTPDKTSNADYHVLYIMNAAGTKRTSHTSSKIAPPSFRRSNLCGYDVIDNELLTTGNMVLVHPSNRGRYESLSDVATLDKSPHDAALATVEKTLMRGRIEEITPEMGGDTESKVTIRGRSLLMDLIDHRSDRDFNLGQGSPVKEIGDMGTPTVSITLGGLGQGGIDIQPLYAEHPFMPGWKDKIVGTGNASVRNDKQASTYYASTRALTEIPLFPSMFFDVNSRLSADNDARTPLPSTHAFKMTVDCTMAINRPEMRSNESRFLVDWGQNSPVASIEVTDQMYDWIAEEDTAKRWLIRCQRPSVQAVVATTAYNTSTGVLTVDDASAFLKTNGERGLTANCADNFYVTIGEGVLNSGYGLVAKASYTNGTSLTLDTSHIWNPLDTASVVTVANTTIDLGMTVTLGGYVVIGGANEPTESPIIYDYVDSTIGAADDPSLTGYGPTLISDLATAIRNLVGLNTDAVHVDPNNANRFYILDGPNMDAFEWDPLETHEASNDRRSVHPVICRTNALAAKGKKLNGTALEYVRPLDLKFDEIALKMGDFEGCVNEVIRRINMAGHPQAKNSNGGSAFDPPPLFPLVATNNDTGTHMGYVRAFPGSTTESREGESGISIVIHSTVPGATGRNFNIRLSNNTPYAYKPVQVVGYGGLLSTNSRLYQPNSFPAPMPIGADGETFVPISTFRGAPSGSALDSEGSVRSYDGLGNSFKVTTMGTTTPTVAKAITTGNVGSETLSAANTTLTIPTQANYYSNGATKIDQLAVSTKTEDYLKRVVTSFGGKRNGILRVKDMLADFVSITQHQDSVLVGTNCFFIRDITPRDNMTDFMEALYDDGADGTGISGVEVELIYPGTDSEGILFFGGGHTGVTFDISDGTANDYSNDYRHYYSKGPTGFAGFQNLHEVSTAAAVLDFTHITNNDTINDNTMQGIHHKMRVNSSGEVENNALAYLRLNTDLTSTSNSGSTIDQAILINEDLYDSATYTTIAAQNKPFAYTSAGPDKGVDATAGATGFKGMQTIALSYWDGDNEATVKKYGPMSEFKGEGDYSISVWFRPSETSFPNDTKAASGPLVCGVDSSERPWGLYLLGKASIHSADWQQIGFAFSYMKSNGDIQTIHNDVADGGIRIQKDTWTNIIVSKLGDVIKIRCGNTSSDGSSNGALRFGTSANGSADVTTMIDLLSGTDGSQARSVITNTSGLQAPAMQPDWCWNGNPIGGSDYEDLAGATVIGLATQLNMATWKSASPDPYQIYDTEGGQGSAIDLVCGTYDGSNAYTRSIAQTQNQWLWNTYLSEVAIFDHALSVAEMDEIFAARAVW